MVVQVACQCGGLPPHSHFVEWVNVMGREVMVPLYEVKIWVDWREVARELVLFGDTEPKPVSEFVMDFFKDEAAAREWENMSQIEHLVPSTTHRCPRPGQSLTPCCKKTPFELPRTDRMTEDYSLVDCTKTQTEKQKLGRHAQRSVEPIDPPSPRDPAS